MAEKKTTLQHFSCISRATTIVVIVVVVVVIIKAIIVLAMATVRLSPLLVVAALLCICREINEMENE